MHVSNDEGTDIPTNWNLDFCLVEHKNSSFPLSCLRFCLGRAEYALIRMYPQVDMGTAGLTEYSTFPSGEIVSGMPGITNIQIQPDKYSI